MSSLSGARASSTVVKGCAQLLMWVRSVIPEADAPVEDAAGEEQRAPGPEGADASRDAAAAAFVHFPPDCLYEDALEAVRSALPGEPGDLAGVEVQWGAVGGAAAAAAEAEAAAALAAQPTQGLAGNLAAPEASSQQPRPAPCDMAGRARVSAAAAAASSHGAAAAGPVTLASAPTAVRLLDLWPPAAPMRPTGKSAGPAALVCSIGSGSTSSSQRPADGGCVVDVEHPSTGVNTSSRLPLSVSLLVDSPVRQRARLVVALEGGAGVRQHEDEVTRAIEVEGAYASGDGALGQESCGGRQGGSLGAGVQGRGAEKARRRKQGGEEMRVSCGRDPAGAAVVLAEVPVALCAGMQRVGLEVEVELPGCGVSSPGYEQEGCLGGDGVDGRQEGGCDQEGCVLQLMLLPPEHGDVVVGQGAGGMQAASPGGGRNGPSNSSNSRGGGGSSSSNPVELERGEAAPAAGATTRSGASAAPLVHFSAPLLVLPAAAAEEVCGLAGAGGGLVGQKRDRRTATIQAAVGCGEAGAGPGELCVGVTAPVGPQTVGQGGAPAAGASVVPETVYRRYGSVLPLLHDMSYYLVATCAGRSNRSVLLGGPGGGGYPEDQLGRVVGAHPCGGGSLRRVRDSLAAYLRANHMPATAAALGISAQPSPATASTPPDAAVAQAAPGPQLPALDPNSPQYDAPMAASERSCTSKSRVCNDGDTKEAPKPTASHAAGGSTTSSGPKLLPHDTAPSTRQHPCACGPVPRPTLRHMLSGFRPVSREAAFRAWRGAGRLRMAPMLLLLTTQPFVCVLLRAVVEGQRAADVAATALLYLVTWAADVLGYLALVLASWGRSSSSRGAAARQGLRHGQETHGSVGTAAASSMSGAGAAGSSGSVGQLVVSWGGDLEGLYEVVTALYGTALLALLYGIAVAQPPSIDAVYAGTVQVAVFFAAFRGVLVPSMQQLGLGQVVQVAPVLVVVEGVRLGPLVPQWGWWQLAAAAVAWRLVGCAVSAAWDWRARWRFLQVESAGI